MKRTFLPAGGLETGAGGQKRAVLHMNRMMKRFFRTFLVAAAFAVAWSCSRDEPAVVPRPEPEERPELTEKQALRDAVEKLASASRTDFSTLRGVEVWQEGYKASGAWFGPDGERNDDKARKTRHLMWSVTKTFTGMAVGMAVAEGKVSLDEKLYDLFPEEADAALADVGNRNVTPEQVANLKACTVRNLLTMTCGHKEDPTVSHGTRFAIGHVLSIGDYLNAGGVDVDKVLETEGSTLVRMFFAFPFEDEPGTNFTYNSLGSHMLAEILRKKTGENPADWLDSRLFKPLGIAKPAWEQVQGVSAGGWGLHLATDEMLAFGRLLLEGGLHEGRQLVPADYLKAAASAHVEFGAGKKPYDATGYGYQTWVFPQGFMATGLFGQYIIVLPARKAVIALASDAPFSFASFNPLVDGPKILSLLQGASASGNDALLDLVWQYILPAL